MEQWKTGWPPEDGYYWFWDGAIGSKPSIVQVSGTEAYACGQEIPDDTKKNYRDFWCGPITLPSTSKDS